MKYPTSKRPPRSLWRRLTRWVRDTVDELTRDEFAGLPSYDDVKARATPISPRPGARSDERV